MTLELRGYRRDPILVPSPIVDDVLRVIPSMDAQSWSMFWVSNEDTEGLYVSGGPQRYLCWLQHWTSDGGDLVIENARDPSAPAGTLSVVLDNGQIDEYPLGVTISHDQVIAVAGDYLASRARTSAVRWELA